MKKNDVKEIVSASASLAADSLAKKARTSSGWVAVALWLAAAVCVGVAALTGGGSTDQQQHVQDEPPASVAPADPRDAR